MLYLLQLVKMLNIRKRHYFYNLFADLSYEQNELGWAGNETELVQTMLLNHFGFDIADERQLKIITETILDKRKFALTMRVVGVEGIEKCF